MSPEMPFIAAGAIAIAGGTAKAKTFPPPEMVRAGFATIFLVIFASATTNSKAAPVVHALGLLLLMASVMAAIPAFSRKPRKTTRKIISLKTTAKE